MIQDDDDIVLSKGDETIREYTIARIIYEFIKGGNFVWSQNVSSENNLIPRLNILYNGEALCTAVNKDIVDRIFIMSKKISTNLDNLKIFYNYTTHDITASGFDISIRANEYADFYFKLRFKLLSERASDSIHYDGRFYMRFVEVNESTKRIVNQIKYLINCEKDNDTEQ